MHQPAHPRRPRGAALANLLWTAVSMDHHALPLGSLTDGLKRVSDHPTTREPLTHWERGLRVVLWVPSGRDESCYLIATTVFGFRPVRVVAVPRIGLESIGRTVRVDLFNSGHCGGRACCLDSM